MRLTIVISLLILSSTIFSQSKSKDVDILWGREFKTSKRSTLDGVVGKDETGIYVIKFHKRGMFSYGPDYSLEHFNKQMNLTKSVKIILSKQGKELELELITHFNNKLYAFSSLRNNKEKKKILYVQSINKNTLRPENDIRKIAEIDYQKKSRFNTGDYYIATSRDKSKLLVYYDTPYDKRENESFGLHIFDENMNQLWEKKISIPYKEDLFSVEKMRVDKEGNVYLVGISYIEKHEDKRKGSPDYKYKILCYTNEGKKLIQYPVELQDKFITDMQITISDEGDIICAGFYSDEGTFSIKGSFFLSIDHENQKIKNKSFKEFGLDFITQGMSERQEKKAKKKAAKGKNVELYKYDLNEIILRDDGGALLIGEQYYVRVVTHTYTDGNGMMHTTTTYYYNYNDIIVINISPKGQIDWIKKIPKQQVTTNDGGFFSSYTLAVIKDKLYFIFNDNPRNLNYKEPAKLYNFNKGKESLTVLVTLTMDGKQKREALFNTRDSGVLIRPKVCKQIDDSNELIIFGQRGKKQRFAKITFK